MTGTKSKISRDFSNMLSSQGLAPGCVPSCLQAAYAPFSSALAGLTGMAQALYEVIAIGAVTRLGEVEAYICCRCVEF